MDVPRNHGTEACKGVVMKYSRQCSVIGDGVIASTAAAINPSPKWQETNWAKGRSVKEK
jgi:hypothetical protein